MLIEFPTMEDAIAWEADEEYAPAKAIRVGSTTNRVEFVASAFMPPGG